MPIGSIVLSITANVVPQYFNEYRKQAKPQIYMKRPAKRDDPAPHAQRPPATPGAASAPANPAPNGVIQASGQKKQ